MLVRLCSDTFVRRFGPYGFITSQLTKTDRVYDVVGAVFLEALSRAPASVAHIVDRLLAQFSDCTHEQIEADLVDFLSDLARDGYVVCGETEEEINATEPRFTYAATSPKTVAAHVLKQSSAERARPSDHLLTDWFGQHPTIFGAHIEVSSNCNERCVHCYQERHVGRHMDRDLFREILDQLTDMGTTSLTISGGEPTLHPHFEGILRQARAHDLMINVLSNGLAVSDSQIDTMRDVGLNMLQISLYSMDPVVHDAVTRVSGSHVRTVATIERLIANEIPVQISCPIMKVNRRAYRDVSCWCRERKIRVLSDFVMMAKCDFDLSNLQHRLSIDETRDVIGDILAEDSEYQLLLALEPKTRDLEDFARRPVCGVCVDNVCFTADGSMYPCSGFRGYVLGNARERPIREIWEQGERVASVRSIRNEAFPKCLRCAARDYCIMCLVRNFNESGGDMFQVAEHFCRVAFLNKELVEERFDSRDRV